MSRPSLAELRSRLKDRDTSKVKFSRDMYPFWNMNYDQEAHIRILYDANEENAYQFFVEKRMHKLPIAGKSQSIACPKMFGEDCPICDRSYKFYKAEGNESQRGKLYYIDKSYIMKALVVKDPLPEDQEHGSFLGKTVTLQVNKQLFDRINADLGTLEETDKPFELKGGFNFIIRKTKKSTPKGDQADYTSSSFARRPSDIPDELSSTITLVDLTTALPKNPGLEKVIAFLDAHDRGIELKDDNTSSNKSSKSESDDGIDGDDKIPFTASSKVEESASVKVEPVTQSTTVTASSNHTTREDTATPASDEDDLVTMILNRNKAKNNGITT